MNERELACIRFLVHARLALAVLAAWLLACAGSPPRPPTTPGPDGTITLALRDRLEWPYRMTRVVIAIDGEVVYARTDAQEPFVWIGTLPAVEGVHALQTAVEVAYASGSWDHTCYLRLRENHGFAVGSGGASVTVDVHVRDRVTDAFPDRVAVSVL